MRSHRPLLAASFSLLLAGNVGCLPGGSGQVTWPTSGGNAGSRSDDGGTGTGTTGTTGVGTTGVGTTGTGTGTGCAPSFVSQAYVAGGFGFHAGAQLGFFATFNGVDGSLLSTFAGEAFNGAVTSMVVSINHIYVGGTFTKFQGNPAPGLARFSVFDYSFDNAFATKLDAGFENGDVLVLAHDGSSRLYVGGSFGKFQGTATHAKFVAVEASGSPNDGDVASGYTASSAFNGPVRAIAASPIEVYVGGGFTSFNDGSGDKVLKHLLRLNLDGTLDTSFFPENRGFDDDVYALALAASMLYVGGKFTNYLPDAAPGNAVPRRRLAAVTTGSGALQTAFDPGSAFVTGPGVTAVHVIEPNHVGGLYVGGSFTKGLRLVGTTVGAVDTTFNLGSGFDGTVRALKWDGISSLHVGGDFVSLDGATARHVARIGSAGSRVGGFDLGSGGVATGLNRPVHAIASSGSTIMLGGQFTRHDAVARNTFGRLLANGSLDTGFLPSIPPNQMVTALAESPDGIYAGLTQQIVRFSAAGLVDPAFTTVNVGDIEVLKFDATRNQLYAGGRFMSFTPPGAGAPTLNYLVRVNADGTVDTTFNPGLPEAVFAMEIVGTQLVVGGASGWLGRINADGTFDGTFQGNHFNAGIRALHYDCTNERLYVAGGFTVFNVMGAQRIARLVPSSGAYDGTFNTASGFDDFVTAVHVDSATGQVYVAGNFTMYGANPTRRAARLNADGSLDTGFAVSLGFDAPPLALGFFSNGDVLFGGAFHRYKGNTASGVARVTASGLLDTGYGPPTGFDGTVLSLF